LSKELSGEQKAIILLRAIGEDAAAQVMKCLEPKDIRKLGRLMTQTASITQEEESVVMNEFAQASASQTVEFQGQEFMKTVLTKALGPDKASRLLDSLTSKSYPGLEALKWVDVKTVAQLLKNEHPQTIAVILANMEPEQAGQVLGLLPEQSRTDVALRIATMNEVQPGVLQTLSESLQETLLASAGSKAMGVGGAEAIADILTRLDKATEGGILAKIAEQDQSLADSIRALMFVFDDLIKLDDRGLQELMKEISKEDLPVALRGANPDVKDKFFKNMSSRAAEMLKEDMETRGPVKVADVEKAQQNILKLCRKLEEEGRIVVAGQGEEMV
jgi:flagellar motor switch protein FliG